MGGMASVRFRHHSAIERDNNQHPWVLDLLPKPRIQSLCPYAVSRPRGRRNSQDDSGSTPCYANICGLGESRCSGCSTKRHMAGDRRARNFALLTFQDGVTVQAVGMFSDKIYLHSHKLLRPDQNELRRGSNLTFLRLSIKLRLNVGSTIGMEENPLTVSQSIRAKLITVISLLGVTFKVQ